MMIRKTPRVKTIDEKVFFAVVRSFAKRRKDNSKGLSMAGKILSGSLLLSRKTA